MKLNANHGIHSMVGIFYITASFGLISVTVVLPNLKDKVLLKKTVINF